MGLQVCGTSVECGTLVVKGRLSLNMASLTLEQVAGKRKKLLTDMGVQMASEVRIGLDSEAADAASGMVEKHLAPLFGLPPDAFNADSRFQDAVAQALKVKRSVMLASVLVTKCTLEEAMALVEPLQGNVVDLSALDLRSRRVAALVVAWLHSVPAGLTRLVIRGDTMGSTVLEALCEFVRKTATLVAVEVMEPPIGCPNGEKLRPTRSLNILQLNGTERIDAVDLGAVASRRLDAELDDVSVAIVCAGLTSKQSSLSTGLKSLKLGSNATIRARHTELLGSALRVNRSLVTLNLAGNPIGNDGAKALAAALLVNRSLTEMSLKDTQISAEGAKTIGASLAQGGALKILDCSSNPAIGGVGAKALCNNGSLSRLSLCSCKLASEGAKAVTEALKCNGSLKTLLLKRNEIGPAGGEAIGSALSVNRSLTVLELSQNGIRAEGARAISDALLVNRSLKTLVLGDLTRGNEIRDEGAKALAEALTVNTSLSELNLERNSIGEEGGRAIAEALRHNVVLRTLKLRSNSLGAAVTQLLMDTVKDREGFVSESDHNSSLPRGSCPPSSAKCKQR